MVVNAGVIPAVVVGLMAFSILVIIRCASLLAGAPFARKKEESMERTNLLVKIKLFALGISETLWAMGTSAILPA